MIQTVVFDTKPYDRGHLQSATPDGSIEWRFLEFRLTARVRRRRPRAPRPSASSSTTSWTGPAWKRWRAQGVKLVALRCTGFNNVDLAAAKELELTVTRVPAYSPYAVAEHAVALLLTLNRKIHRAFNRVRELNFSLNGLVGFDLHGKTAGIVGTGKIGRIAAQILRGFGMTVLAFDPFPTREWAQQQRRRVCRCPHPRARERRHLAPHSADARDPKHIIRGETLELMKPARSWSTSAGAR